MVFSNDSVGGLTSTNSINSAISGENANVPAKLEELNKTYGTPNLISEVARQLVNGNGWRFFLGKSWGNSWEKVGTSWGNEGEIHGNILEHLEHHVGE